MPKFIHNKSISDEYTENKGLVCPYCGSEDIEPEDVDVKGTELFQEMYCNLCQGFFRERYELKGADILEEYLEK